MIHQGAKVLPNHKYESLPCDLEEVQGFLMDLEIDQGNSRNLSGDISRFSQGPWMHDFLKVVDKIYPGLKPFTLYQIAM